MKKATFSLWLWDSLRFIGRGPVVWVGYSLMIGALMPVGRISLALGILISVSSLFIGVGVNKYIDLKYTDDNPVALSWAIKKSLPLSFLAALTLAVFWFTFNVVANLLSGEADKILLFFYNWELTPENINRLSTRELGAWIYTYANIVLIFTLLMLTTFASWFSFPLMLFRNYSFSQAREQGEYQVSRNKSAFYKMMGFIFIETLLCSSVTPLLTPVLYMLVSTFIYVSYQSTFGTQKQR